jgi:hypothetical protein
MSDVQPHVFTEITAGWIGTGWEGELGTCVFCKLEHDDPAANHVSPEGIPRGTYNNPTAAQLAAEVADEAALRDEMRDEYDRERIAEYIVELESMGYTVTRSEEDSP